jgi:hypothetical protein
MNRHTDSQHSDFDASFDEAASRLADAITTDLIADPIVRLLMSADGVDAESVIALLRKKARQFRNRTSRVAIGRRALVS